MPMQTVSSPEDIMEILRESWNRHDMATYTSLFDQDALYVSAVGMEWRGHTAIERAHTSLHKEIFGSSTITAMDNRYSTIAPGVVIVACQWEMVGVRPTQGWAMSHPRRGIMTLVLVQKNGAWRIVSVQNTETREVPTLNL